MGSRAARGSDAAVLPADGGLEVLAVQRVSKTQAWQRTGRAGREDSGVCYRLYTEDEFEKFDKMTVPEIQRWAPGAPALPPSRTPAPPRPGEPAGARGPPASPSSQV